MTKTCKKCEQDLPLEEYHKNKNSKDGLAHSCKSCKKIENKQNYQKIKSWHKQYYKENKEKINEYSKKYAKENKDKIKEQVKIYRQENKEKLKEKSRIQYYEKGGKERQKKYYQENKEHLAALGKEWREKNKEKIKEYHNQYYYKIPPSVYKITSKKTGEVYIGCSLRLVERWIQHKSTLKHNRHANKNLQKIYDEYGLDNLKFEVLREYPQDITFQQLHKEETKFVLEYASKGVSVFNQK